MKCRYACGNDARYIDEFGMFVCGVCPIREGVDAIKFDDVGRLLRWARQFERSLSPIKHDQLIDIIGRKP